MKKKKFRFVFRRLFAGLLCVFLFVFLPSVGSGKNQNMAMLYNVFVGNKSEYQGILEIWNIDTFEGASKSKTSLLLDAGDIFKKENKGVYLLVRNMTETECVNLLQSGVLPDLFSCSYGVAEKLKDYVEPLENNDFSIAKNLLNAGVVDGKQVGVPWCLSSYHLISTKERLKNAGLSDASLLKNVFDLGYKKTLKNKTEIVYSLSFGEGDYLCPQKAILSYYNEGALNLKETSINKDSAKGTSYSAYCRFVANESTILLGTNRDIERMNKRLAQGKVEDVVFEPLTKFTDLVQFVFLAKGENAQKDICKQKFVEVLTGAIFQEKVVESGLYSVAKTSVMQDIPFEIIEDYSVLNVFVTKNEIEKLREKLFLI